MLSEKYIFLNFLYCINLYKYSFSKEAIKNNLQVKNVCICKQID